MLRQKQARLAKEQLHLHRREFLRVSAVVAGGAALTACQQCLSNLFSPAVELTVRGGDRDVWAWSKLVGVQVSGDCERVLVSFNGQQVEARPQGDFFTAEVHITDGSNEVSAVCIRQGGSEIRSEPVILTGRLRQAPRAVIEIEAQGDQVLFDGRSSLPAPDGSSLQEYAWSTRHDNPSPLHVNGNELQGEIGGSSLTLRAPAVAGEYYMRLRVKDQAGREDTSTIYFVVESGQARVPDYDRENPAWLETAVVYGVIPFLFGSPAFRSVRDRLDDLADLGINAIWLGPINRHPADDYGYAVEDYFTLDPAYGSNEDFRELVRAAHERGIRVLMDFVPNHTSNTHPYFVDAQEHGPASPYWDFYDRDAQGNYTYYFQWEHLPNLNFRNPEVRRMMTEAFAYWVREFNVDGFRVDVVWGVAERYPDYWLEWRRELKRIKPDLLLLAEATARDPYYFENGFDVAYDWTDQPGAWAWDIVWTAANQYRLIGYNLTTALLNRPEGYHPDALIFRFINNNDTFKRFISRHGEAITRLATALLLTLPGIPCLYTGDEYGLEFEPYQQVEPLIFEEQYPGLRDYHKRLIALRKEVPSLHSRLWAPIKHDAIRQEVFAYVRYDEETNPPILVLLNFSEEAAEFRFDTPAEFGAFSDGGALYDLLAAESVPAFGNDRLQISVPAFTARILAKEEIAVQ